MVAGIIEKVSIVMCTYNGEKYLREQLDTLLNQTYPIAEIIIQDDRSTDDTMSILKDYESKHPHIHVSQNEEQKGVNKNFFSAIARASGDYIALSDQDDLWEPDKIEKQINSIGNKFLSAGISEPFAEGQDTSIHYDTRIPNMGVERIIYTSMVAGHTMMFRKELINSIPNLDDWIDFVLYDHFLQIVASSLDSLAYCPVVLVRQRRHITSATYDKPLNYKKNFRNLLESVGRTIRNYKDLRPQMRSYFSQIYCLLDEVDTSSEGKRNAMCLAKYHSARSFGDYLKLSFLCVRLRDKIFHTKEKNKIISIMRALYFPISCSDYFRYMKKSS